MIYNKLDYVPETIKKKAHIYLNEIIDLIEYQPKPKTILTVGDYVEALNH